MPFGLSEYRKSFEKTEEESPSAVLRKFIASTFRHFMNFHEKFTLRWNTSFPLGDEFDSHETRSLKQRSIGKSSGISPSSTAHGEVEQSSVSGGKATRSQHYSQAVCSSSQVLRQNG